MYPDFFQKTIEFDDGTYLCIAHREKNKMLEKSKGSLF